MTTWTHFFEIQIIYLPLKGGLIYIFFFDPIAIMCI